LDTVITIGIVFVLLCVCPLLAGLIADRKGRRVLPWALLGGIWTVLIVAVLPRVEPRSVPSS
jgi:MFS family permease